jgi:hypothetical protein
MIKVSLCLALLVNVANAVVHDKVGGAQQAQAPIRLSSLSADRPMQVKNVPAVYPADAPKIVPFNGGVMVDISIGLDGKVVDARPVGATANPGGKSGGPNRAVSPLVVQVAVDAARQWEFEPPRVQGEPMPVVMTVFVGVQEQRFAERRQQVTIPQRWKYNDATMAAAYDTAQEVETPLMVLKRELEAEGFRCLTSDRANTYGRIETNHLSTKVYLVECWGDCRGLNYGVAVGQGGQVRDLGAARGYPLLEVRVPFLVDTDIHWQFTRAPVGLPPIRVHTFTKVRTESNVRGCEFGR